MVGIVGLAPKELDSSDMATRDSLQSSTAPPRRRSVIIGDQALEGDLAIPPVPCGLIIFAHGSGSSRRSPRNVFVASSLQHRGFATLLFDLLTEDEAADRANVFDIGLLAGRVRLFEEPGALEAVVTRASALFETHCQRLEGPGR
jgi:hypothetical protein